MIARSSPATTASSSSRTSARRVHDEALGRLRLVDLARDEHLGAADLGDLDGTQSEALSSTDLGRRTSA